MDRFSELEIFQAVAEEASFAGAARRLSLSPPAVTRRVAQLESRLGVKLFNRTTRSVRTTEAGLSYLEDTRRVLAALEAADDQAMGINAQPRGQLRVTAPVLFGRLYVLPGILNFLAQYPGMTVDMVLLDRVVNLLEEGLDVGVRIGELPDSSMRALKVGVIRQVWVASLDYLKQQGEPTHPRQLIEHTTINNRAGIAGMSWRYQEAERERHAQIKPRLTVTTNDAAIDAAKNGFGITRVLSYQVAEAINNGELKVILSDYEPTLFPIQIVHREDRFSPLRVRTFIDGLAEYLRSQTALQMM